MSLLGQTFCQTTKKTNNNPNTENSFLGTRSSHSALRLGAFAPPSLPPKFPSPAPLHPSPPRPTYVNVMNIHIYWSEGVDV